MNDIFQYLIIYFSYHVCIEKLKRLATVRFRYTLFIEKKYGTVLIGTSFLIMCFSVAWFTIFLSTISLWADDDSGLTKLGTATSVGGVFLGTFIAIWLINRDRNKRITENHVYKISLLVNLEGITHAVLNVIREYKMHPDYKEGLLNIVKTNEESFKYWSHLIEQINTNTIVPAEIRSAVSLLLHQGIKPIFLPDLATDGWDFLHVTFLGPLNTIIESPYMKYDRDHGVMHYLKMVRNSRETLEKTTGLNEDQSD